MQFTPPFHPIPTWIVSLLQTPVSHLFFHHKHHIHHWSVRNAFSLFHAAWYIVLGAIVVAYSTLVTKAED